MAKAKKPTSGNKSKAQPPKADASKVDAAPSNEGNKAKTPPQAAQTGAVKSDRKVTSTTKPIETVSSAAKTPDPVKPENSAAKSSSAVTASETKSDSTKPTDSSAAKAVETKSETKTSKPKDTPAKPAEAKTPEKVEAKAEQAKKPTPTATKEPEPVKQEEKSGGGFFPLLLGGVIAGGLGFAAAEMNVLNTRPDIDALKATLEAQQAQLDAFAPADLSGVEAGIAAVETGIAGVTETVTAIDTRLVVLEERPVIVANDGESLSAEFMQQLESLQTSVQDQKDEVAGLLGSAKELETLKSSVEEQNAEIARLLEDALSVEEATAKASRDAAIQAATAKLTAAMTTGAAYDEVIADLDTAGIGDLPPALTDPAADGIPTVQMLQTEFPATARAALASARAAGVDAGTGGVGGFLKRQLGARSVAPREGSDPDAVLSRAEAAVRSGRVGVALEELDTLPPEVQGAMEDWLALARVRAGAEQAVEDLSERLTAN